MRLGLLSTAKINGEILAGASESDLVEVVAVASRSAARAEAYGREHGIPRTHGSYESLLADENVDAVYISLPNELHYEWTVRALAAGKHVLCEKPYSKRPEQVEEAFGLAERDGLVLMEAFMYRHHPQTRRVAELVAAGAVGRLALVRTVFTNPLAPPSDFRWSPEHDGGALMDLGCYCVNGTRLLAGEPELVAGEQVAATSGVDATFAGTMRFPGDVIAQFSCSLTLPVQQRLEAVGEEATLLVEAPWRVDWGGSVLLRRGSETERIEVPGSSSYRLELENLVHAIAGTADPLLGRADALGQARAIDALYRAAETGASVSL